MLRIDIRQKSSQTGQAKNSFGYAGRRNIQRELNQNNLTQGQIGWSMAWGRHMKRSCQRHGPKRAKGILELVALLIVSLVLKFSHGLVVIFIVVIVPVHFFVLFRNISSACFAFHYCVGAVPVFHDLKFNLFQAVMLDIEVIFKRVLSFSVQG